jgi:hypothetical protein
MKIRWFSFICNLVSVIGLCAFGFHYAGWRGLSAALCLWGLIETCTDPDRYQKYRR